MPQRSGRAAAELPKHASLRYRFRIQLGSLHLGSNRRSARWDLNIWLKMPMLRPRLQTPTMLDTTPAQPAAPQHRPSPIRRARSLGNYLPVVSLPPSKARPTTCVAIPGSARPTAQMEFTTAWYLVPAASVLLIPNAELHLSRPQLLQIRLRGG